MKIISKERALDKIYKRRDRYEIPDWQREKVWQPNKKQSLIDSILRGWKLPKFYFLKTSDDPEEFEVVDGQQRLTTIFEFFDNALSLSPSSSKKFSGSLYKELSNDLSDAFDDFEIQYDEITEATDSEVRNFFQRLQQGLPLSSSEKLNATTGALRNFCKLLAANNFFKTKVAFANKRYAHFDVASKVAAIEIEGLDAGLRFKDLEQIMKSQSKFSKDSAVGRRLQNTFDYLDKAFSTKTPELRNRALVQSFATLAVRIVETGRSTGSEKDFKRFVEKFVTEFSKQVELGLKATDEDYIDFQRSINANVKGSAKLRHMILLRKLLRLEPSFANLFDSTAVAKSGLNKEIARLGISISGLIEELNEKYSAKHGIDLFKPTNKTVGALNRLAKPIKSFVGYKSYISDLYFIFRESISDRLGKNFPRSFSDVNSLRTDLNHDLDHGRKKRLKAKRKRISAVFGKYASAATPSTMAPEHFPVFQASLMSALEADLRQIAI